MTHVTKVLLNNIYINKRNLNLQQAEQIGKKSRFILGDTLGQDFTDICVYFLGNEELKSLKDTFRFEKKNGFSSIIPLKTYRNILKNKTVETIQSRLDITVTSLNAVQENTFLKQFGDGLIVIREQGSNVEHVVRSVSRVVKNQTLFNVCTSKDVLETFFAVLLRIYLNRDKEAINRLKELFECRQKSQQLRPFERLSEGDKSVPVEDHTTEQNHTQTLSSKRKRTVKGKYGNAEHEMSMTRSGKRFKHSYEDDIRQNERDLIRDTLHEASALYRRSQIPDEENPFPKRELPSLTCELTKAIYAVDQCIYGCGFRNYTLEVFVRCNPSDMQRISLRHSLRKVAERFHIDEIDVKFGNFKEIKMSSCQVGSKIKSIQESDRNVSTNELSERVIYTRRQIHKMAVKFATLGGFAKDENQKLYILLSRHFADPDFTQSIYFIDNKNRQYILANLLKEHSARGKYDISVATVLPDNVQNTRFRNMNGVQLESILESFDSQTDANEMPVFFWSWNSKPRRGKIVIQEFNERSSDAKLVLLKDVMEYNAEHNDIIPVRMVEKGNSGAIICSDDPNYQRVRVWTMLMGVLNPKEIDNPETGWKKQGIYRSLPICEAGSRAGQIDSINYLDFI
ncbi:uncharacterized protein LOC128222475 [Mya arenaria]|uniref:uncharacterized protein LOC128222475 n=1 Tax=Mya arenaria TaxID=6604 RepID=UPI0022E06181|nr:uncharacterized protein LOC128222475 [Mya arenaria]